MSDLSTLTLRLPRATTDKLERLAGQRHTTRDALVGEALADFADRELAIAASIERGLAEIDAGLGLETGDVFRDVEAAIDASEAGRTEFTVETAQRHAIDARLDRRLFRLHPDGYDAFMHALDNPPAPGPKLRTLMRRTPAWRS